MTTQVYYRKWRPGSFAELVGQEHVATTLRQSVKQARISHSYLFCGPRGSGKTTTARIIAKAANCLDLQDGDPCNQCAICQAVNDGRFMDIIELDAASNRGIDEIRDIRDKVNFSPAQGSRKVYIIDEAHMLTDAAANAFLKTLEEPPGHVIFILCTTEAHKIIPTIVSRCQRFDFRRIPSELIYGRLKEMVDSVKAPRWKTTPCAWWPAPPPGACGTPKTCWSSWCFPPPTGSASARWRTCWGWDTGSSGWTWQPIY